MLMESKLSFQKKEAHEESQMTLKSGWDIRDTLGYGIMSCFLQKITLTMKEKLVCELVALEESLHVPSHVSCSRRHARNSRKKTLSCLVSIKFISFITSTAINPFTPELNLQAMPCGNKF